MKLNQKTFVLLGYESGILELYEYKETDELILIE